MLPTELPISQSSVSLLQHVQAKDIVLIRQSSLSSCVMAWTIWDYFLGNLTNILVVEPLLGQSAANNILDTCKKKVVIFTDFCFSAAFLMDIARVAERVFVMSNSQAIERVIAAARQAVPATNQGFGSGATNTIEIVKIPPLDNSVQPLVGDCRDPQPTFSLDSAAALYAYLMPPIGSFSHLALESYDFTDFDCLKSLLHEQESLKLEGETISRAFDVIAASIASRAVTKEDEGGHTYFSVNCPRELWDRVCSCLLDINQVSTTEFVHAWDYDEEQKCYNHFMQSIAGGIDVGEIARTRGGGGDANHGFFAMQVAPFPQPESSLILH